MEPTLMISPWPPSGRFWKMGMMAWVTLMRPVTLVEKTTFMSCSSISGARATPLTRPLRVGSGQTGQPLPSKTSTSADGEEDGRMCVLTHY